MVSILYSYGVTRVLPSWHDITEFKVEEVAALEKCEKPVQMDFSYSEVGNVPVSHLSTVMEAIQHCVTSDDLDSCTGVKDNDWHETVATIVNGLLQNRV